LSDGSNGLPLIDQYFLFNPVTQKVGRADGGDLPGGFNMQGSYGNSLIDSTRLKKHKRLLLGTVLVQSESTLMFYGEGCADVGISFEDHAQVMLSPNYVASLAGMNQSHDDQRAGYSAVVFFDPREYKHISPADQEFVSGILRVSRNGSRPAQFTLNFSSITTPSDIDNIPLADTGFPVIEVRNIHRNTDTIEWSVEQGGKVSLKGVCGFPVAGTVPKIVYYRIDLPQGMHGHGTRSGKQSAQN
jgi:hypothetical protein